MKLIALLITTMSLLLANIDINKATAKELSTLKGIGIVKAKSIVKFREGHCFKDIKELSLVRGIGKRTIEKNLKNLKVSDCKIHIQSKY